MKAMILAAGVGSRLRPLTDSLPKALAEVGGRTMLEHVMRRLVRAGVTEVVLNLHHLPEAIETFFKRNGTLGLRVEFSREPELLDTGGGLKQAAGFFDDGRPFFVHNVDVYTDLDLSEMYRAHLASGTLATLAVHKRKSDRLLLFTPDGRLCGREVVSESRTDWASAPVKDCERLAFDGIHVVSPELLSRMTETGAFPIIQTYLRLAGAGARILAFRTDGRYWRDIGRLSSLEALRKDLATQQ